MAPAPPRLTELEQYQQAHPVDPLDDDEQAFLRASQKLIEDEIDEQKKIEAAERQAREDIARAELERQQSRSRFLRNTVIALGAVVLMMVAMAGFFCFYRGARPQPATGAQYPGDPLQPRCGAAHPVGPGRRHL